ncbi:MAG: hypothetical protein IGS39_23335 [Calothrix sp. C42_A2020_038]|nr:hypothetical protein [Calothrix sp. C42_A2020_038]
MSVCKQTFNFCKIARQHVKSSTFQHTLFKQNGDTSVRRHKKDSNKA